ncbi:hypothetical protein GCK72_010486 [Caenorhabditis remanei]|uniref:SPK domain-containing protein n=1 Tax=Caenorhabditis remanei TaxID=31234 RepID=A0A6A5H652_CAERE|nr:hypothetical protein GCK72_010486 [Caenorhabditis remanei]KAF1762224.1 hypothetical protein GCK72_010486 [Caenorhabditis remanei]
MARGRNAKRNKSTASVGSKKNRTQSTTSTKFQQSVDGFSAFIVSVSKLGKNGHEFTWHDLRKVYHKETQRQLTAEELNAIFSAKSLTKREIFELPKVKRFMESMDGSMMCRFRLIGEPDGYQSENDDIPPLMSTSLESDVVTQNSTSPNFSQAASPIMPNEKSIAISTDCDDKTGGPTSDLSKSDNSPSQRSLVQQSSMTDDEGWVSGRDTRSDNSSPVEIHTDKDEVDGGSKMELDDEVFEDEHRIEAGSDNVDGHLVTDVLVVEEATVEQKYKEAENSYIAPIVMTESITAAFEAVIQSVHANATLPETQNSSATARVHATPRKVLSPPVPAERTTVSSDELSTGAPIKRLIEKFDTAVNFVEQKIKRDGSPQKSIYTQVLEEIKETEHSVDQEVLSTKTEEHEEAEVTNVIFRSTSTHSSIIANGKEQLAEFVAEQEAKHKEKPATPKITNANTTTEETENAFCAKEQSSMSSLDREYFDSKTKHNLGVKDPDGFQLKTVDSCGSGPASSEIITVIETPSKVLDAMRKRTDSVESDADVPYSLCSEDEGEPMTMIEKSMKASQSAEQLSKPKEEVRAKTVVVNVELDGQAKRDSNDTNAVHVKDRVAALQALVVDKSVPIAKIDSLDKEEVLVLSRNEELPHIALEAKPATGTIRRRHVRFMRGCCVVQ